MRSKLLARKEVVANESEALCDKPPRVTMVYLKLGEGWMDGWIVTVALLSVGHSAVYMQKE